eukprot:scaffold54034_cov69-Phaeocystis_antarctica.AAC.2
MPSLSFLARPPVRDRAGLRVPISAGVCLRLSRLKVVVGSRSVVGAAVGWACCRHAPICASASAALSRSPCPLGAEALLLAATHVIAPAGRHVDTDTPAGSVAGWCTEQQAQLRTEEEEHAKRHRGQRGEPRRGHNAAKDQARTSRPQGKKDIVSARVHTHTRSVAAPGAPARGGLHGDVTNALGVRQHPGYAPEPGEHGLRARAADVGARQEKADGWRGHAHTPHAAAPGRRPSVEIPYQGEDPAAGWHTGYAPEPREEGPQAERADAGAREQRIVGGGEGGGLRASPRRQSPATPGYTRHGSHPDGGERPGERRYTGRSAASTAGTATSPRRGANREARIGEVTFFGTLFCFHHEYVLVRDSYR